MSNYILAAVQADETGRHILDVARRVAAAQSATLHVLNVVEPAIAVYADLNFAPLAETSGDWQRAIMRENQRFLESCVEGADATVTVIEGRPVFEISRRAEEAGADLIVMGLHNRRGLQRLMGSTTNGVLNHSHCNLLAVHPDSGSEAYGKVLIAIDTTELAEHVLELGKAHATDTSDVAVISALIPLNTVFAAPEAGRGLDWSFTELSNDVYQHTRCKLKGLTTGHGLTEAQLEIAWGEPRDEIVRAAQEHHSELITIGANNRNALNRLLLGSTARGVLDRAPCDVLVYHPT